MISATGKPLLCDFGLSRIRHEVTRTHTIIREGGRARFLAPELLDGPEEFRTSKASDVYSLALVLYSACAHSAPFTEYPNERAAGAAARSRIRPARPSNDVSGGLIYDVRLRDLFWGVLEEMWAHDASERPSAQDVETRLDALFVHGVF